MNRRLSLRWHSLSVPTVSIINEVNDDAKPVCSTISGEVLYEAHPSTHDCRNESSPVINVGICRYQDWLRSIPDAGVTPSRRDCPLYQQGSARLQGDDTERTVGRTLAGQYANLPPHRGCGSSLRHSPVCRPPSDRYDRWGTNRPRLGQRLVRQRCPVRIRSI